MNRRDLFRGLFATAALAAIPPVVAAEAAGTFVVVGNAGMIYTSQDGIRWDEIGPAPAEAQRNNVGFTHLSYKDGLWTAIGVPASRPLLTTKPRRSTLAWSTT